MNLTSPYFQPHHLVTGPSHFSGTLVIREMLIPAVKTQIFRGEWVKTVKSTRNCVLLLREWTLKEQGQWNKKL